ncbi:CAAX amino terminal protease self- immunity [Posidoniimonas polymericola]|uniref:CAAX amino terminal protease self-immunity n=1 Tax=Posidoniimonas polymericola TaxID=2528002 RepID=A0A5C5YVD5_9BACT|nr:type II CAAX endopeptidase family protein [Posidoniimonas polymericola]TWT78583.1 CAAX amino terminal protease self- immunity [Posidoniimonas polymericola]
MDENRADHSELPPEPMTAPPPAKPRVWTALLAPFAGVALAVALQAGIAIVVAISLAAQGVPPAELGDRVLEVISSPAGMLVLVAAGPGAFGVVTLLAGWLSPESLKRRLGFNRVRNAGALYGLTVVGSIVPLAVAIALATWVASWAEPLGLTDNSFVAFFENVTPAQGVVFVLLIALVPGFCEEMLFRGFVQQRLIQRWGPAWGIGVASVLFALAHIMPPNIAVALPMGVWLGVIAWRTGSIWPSIACHAFVNGGLNAWRLVAKFGELTDAQVMTGNVAFVAVGAVFFVLACRVLIRYPQEAEE